VPPPALEVADLLRTLAQQGRLPVVSSSQAKVVKAILACRTAALGGHVDVCEECGYEANSFNSCRNRHCPKCQGRATAAWLEAQHQNLLPVPYAHVVFTLPDLLAPLALQNPQVVYGLLFRAASQTLLQVAATPQHLGARIGFLAILHTWGQNLLHHPHIHCVVPAGGVALDGSRWVRCRPGFFLPVRVLSRLYRGKFLSLLQEAYQAGALQCHGRLADLRSARAFRRLLSRARALEWVVYAKPPFGGPEAVLKYLARYTHRIAISNQRLLEATDDHVSFTWKDYRHEHRRRVMTLDISEFVRRFLLHVLPHRFVKIRYYGFLSQSQRATALSQCRGLLDIRPNMSATSADSAANDTDEVNGDCASERVVCPSCHRGRLVYDRALPAVDSS
jgi:predicted Zn-ribbon and HTH transcriptional regulator